MGNARGEELKYSIRRGWRFVKHLFLVLLAIAVIAFGSLGLWKYFLTPGYEIADLPEYSGEPSIVLEHDIPGFDESEIWDGPLDGPPYEKMSELDSLGRAGQALACVGPETMPEGERESMGMDRQSGWQLSKYDFIDNGGYLYNRCHLIGWQLTGNLDDIRLLITGTRYMNIYGMLPYENMIASYVRRTGNHVMYRVTPIFSGRELLARGVQMEAYSIEDDGEGISFNVFCYNVQPGVIIDYETGENWPE